VAGGAVFLEADRDVNVGCYSAACLFVGEGAAAECLDVGQVERRPDRCLGVVEFLAGSDDLDLAESGDEGRDVPVAHVVLLAELAQRGEEVLAVVEGDPETAAQGELMATHSRLLASRSRTRRWGLLRIGIAAGHTEHRTNRGLVVSAGEQSAQQDAGLERRSARETYCRV
jgi:hypothetical protein